MPLGFLLWLLGPPLLVHFSGTTFNHVIWPMAHTQQCYAFQAKATLTYPPLFLYGPDKEKYPVQRQTSSTDTRLRELASGDILQGQLVQVCLCPEEGVFVMLTPGLDAEDACTSQGTS